MLRSSRSMKYYHHQHKEKPENLLVKGRVDEMNLSGGDGGNESGKVG